MEMKRNIDSIRAVLLYLEDNLKIGNPVSSHTVSEEILRKEGCTFGFEDDILYAIKQLYDSEMIDANIVNYTMSDFPNYFIKDIRPAGHDFLENIHNNEIWEKTKAKASKVGSFSIQIIGAIAKQLVLESLHLL